MSITLYNEDCIERMKKLPDKSIDLFITDLPYASKKFGKCVSCKWDTPIELDDMWKQYKRLRKSKKTPMFFFCNVKHGVDLITSNPKMFRRELVWIKSSATGFLNARKMELKKTEYIYIFYEKLPFYDISSHKHKFKDKKVEFKYEGKGKDLWGMKSKDKNDFKGRNGKSRYTRPLPSNIIDNSKWCEKGGKGQWGKLKRPITDNAKEYVPKLPTNVIDNGMITGGEEGIIYNNGNPLYRADTNLYEPKLPSNVIDEKLSIYNKTLDYDNKELKKAERGQPRYEPKLPTNVIDKTIDALYLEHPPSIGTTEEDIYDNITKRSNAKGFRNAQPSNYREAVYEPPLPNNVMRIKSVRKGLHPTQKPVSIIERILKYYSKPGWTVLDMCCGSGSTGKACKNMGRNFIGIELDKKIFDICKKRLNE